MKKKVNFGKFKLKHRCVLITLSWYANIWTDSRTHVSLIPPPPILIVWVLNIGTKYKISLTNT